MAQWPGFAAQAVSVTQPSAPLAVAHLLCAYQCQLQTHASPANYCHWHCPVPGYCNSQCQSATGCHRHSHGAVEVAAAAQAVTPTRSGAGAPVTPTRSGVGTPTRSGAEREPDSQSWSASHGAVEVAAAAQAH